MSRSERRAYKRMTRNQDPYALPASAAQRIRAQQKQRSRRAPRGTREFRFITGRFLVWAVAGAFIAGLLAFSVAWPRMPLAVYAGVGVLVGWAALAWLVRWLQSRAAAQR
jgi:hypothetical protein